MDTVRFLTAGDCAVTVELGDGISEAVNRRIRALSLALEKSPIPGVVETVPTYRSLMVHYDPGVIACPALEKALRGLIGGLDRTVLPPSDVLEIPVLANAFGFTPVSWPEYGIALALAFLVIPVVELVKLCQRRAAARRAQK